MAELADALDLGVIPNVGATQIQCRLALDDAASAYGVSESLLRMRLNVTGAYARIARAG